LWKQKYKLYFVEFEDGLTQRFATNTDQERTDWIQAIRLAGYDVMRAQLQYLRDQIEKRRGNRIDVDVDMHRLQTGKEIGDLIQF
jgi:inositol polyphosphate-4-phosphatase